MTVPQSANPFFEPWTTPHEVPPFGRITPEHFRPAYARAFADHEAEIAAIAAAPEPPSFDNTIGALELGGRALARVENVFHLLVGAHSNDTLLEIERRRSPRRSPVTGTKSTPTRRCSGASKPSYVRPTRLACPPSRSGSWTVTT